MRLLRTPWFIVLVAALGLAVAAATVGNVYLGVAIFCLVLTATPIWVHRRTASWRAARPKFISLTMTIAVALASLFFGAVTVNGALVAAGVVPPPTPRPAAAERTVEPSQPTASPMPTPTLTSSSSPTASPSTTPSPMPTTSPTRQPTARATPTRRAATPTPQPTPNAAMVAYGQAECEVWPMVGELTSLMRGPMSEAVANDDLASLERLHDQFRPLLGDIQVKLFDLNDWPPGETMYAQLHDATTAFNFGVLDLLIGMRFHHSADLAAGSQLIDDGYAILAYAQDEWASIQRAYPFNCASPSG